MPEQEQGNERISPTAWTIAHRRTVTDIPYSKAIFGEIEKLRELQGVDIPDQLKSPEIAPQIEARYKLVSRLLAQNRIEQVLEIAAGFSPRGLELTENRATYVEVDLPGIMTQKKKIVNSIGSNENLFLEEGNALDATSLQTATRHFDRSKPLGIIHEGLLRYLTFEQKATVARNIHKILSAFNGVWITPDITLKAVVQAENTATQQTTGIVGELIGVNIDKNSFEDVNHAQRFFEGLDFSVERHSFMEVIDELSSPAALHQTRQNVEALINAAYVFVMRTKEK